MIVAFNPAYPHITGRIVDVIKAPPIGVGFKLPNGKSHYPVGVAASWIIRFHNPVSLSAVRGRANGLFAVCHDYALRPIRDPGEDAVDETLVGNPVPVREEMTA